MSGEAQSLPDNSTFGQYKIVRLLGKGGMGEVYEVVHGILGTQHAMKLVHAEMMDQDGALERFLLEGRAMAGLSHPGIVQVDDFGQTENHHWLRMELMKGREVSGQKIVSLRDYIAFHGGRLNEEDVSSFVEAMLEALAYAHDKGLVHRDLKPSNILFDGNRLKVADFGLVNAAGADWMQTQVGNTVNSPNAEDTLVDSGTSNSRSQSLMGTYAYMSPEQRQGLPVDARSDLYAIGLMAFHMLTGKETPGFRAASQMVEGLSAGWDVWLERALQENPDDRFPSAREMDKAMAFPPDIQELDSVSAHKTPSVDFGVGTVDSSAEWVEGDPTAAQPVGNATSQGTTAYQSTASAGQGALSPDSIPSTRTKAFFKRIIVGALLFVLGWTLQSFYVSRLFSAGGLAMQEFSHEVGLQAEGYEGTFDERLKLAKVYKNLYDQKRPWEELQEIREDQEAIQKDIRDYESELYRKDETIEGQVEAEIARQQAVAQALNSWQGAVNTTGFGIILKIVGIILIIPPCLSIIPSAENSRTTRLVAQILVFLGVFFMLTDDMFTSAVYQITKFLPLV